MAYMHVLSFNLHGLCSLHALAGPVAGLRGGGCNLVQGPNLGYPKTENSTDVTHHFFGRMDPNLLYKK